MEKLIMNFFIKLFMNLIHMSISAGYLILAVLLVRFLLQKAPKRMRSLLWLFVGIRLMVPFSVESVFSLIPDTKTVDAYLYEMELPVDNTVADTDMKKPVSQLIQNTFVPNTASAQTGRTKIQTIWMLCTKIWIAGMAFMVGYMFYSYLRLKNRVRMSVPAEVVLKNHVVKYYQCDAIESPFLFGILHPRIYIPCKTASDEIPYVLSHELTHKKRKDYLIKPLGFLILSVYWFHPCVWVAYIMLCKDIELICDEYVVRELGTEYKKAYSQALLNSTVNHRMITACPIAFGEISVKERVKNVLNYKKPAFWMLAAAVLACIVVPVCFMTQKKTDASTQEDLPEAAQTDLHPTIQDNTIPKDNQTDSVDKIVGEYQMTLSKSEQEEFLPLDAYNDTYEDVSVFTPRLSLDKDGTFSFGYDPFSSYLSVGEYDIVSNCVKAVTHDGKYHYQFTSVGYGMLRFDAEKSSDLHKTNTDAVPAIEDGSIFVKIGAELQEQTDAFKEPKLTVAAKTIEQWAIAFCDRDAETILDFADEAVIEQFVEQELLFLDEDGGNESASFGWSSPWPWGAAYDENGRALNYHIVSATEHNAEILYYAWVSDPHVTVWRELLTYDMEDDTCVITSESLQYMDSICIAEEFHQAYPNGITETMMDYYSFNGAGEALNQNAVENRNSDFYKKLFAPDTAAVYLLNILNNPNKVGTRVRESVTDKNVCIVTFDFYEDGSTVSVQMIRPYGSDGIWVPYTDASDMTEISGQNSDAAADSASVNVYTINGENVGDIVKEDARQLEALFPNHHEQISTVDFPQNIDLNGDGAKEKIELINLGYNGGDGGYALRVTDTRTGEQIALPDGYSEESGFPIFSTYLAPEGEEPRLMIQLGEEKRCQIVAVLEMDALFQIYEQNQMMLSNPEQNQKRILADAVSGCNIVTYSKEETPVLLLKTYVSGFLGHADTLGYVITELRLGKDNTWSARHFFLLDSCDAQAIAQQEAETAENKAGGSLVYPHKMEINMIPLTPDAS